MAHYREALGLDIRKHVVRAVKLSRQAGVLSVEGADAIRLPEHGEEARTVLRKFLEKKGWLDLPCVVGLSGESTILRTLEVAPNDPRLPDGLALAHLAQLRYNGLEKVRLNVWDGEMRRCRYGVSNVALCSP